LKIDLQGFGIEMVNLRLNHHMPEGPSILILRDMLTDLQLVGKPILAAGGTAGIDHERLMGKKVLAFKSWGKHFLICLEGFTIRIHLMLFGTYLINESNKRPAKLSLEFPGTELNFYSCIVTVIEGDLDKVYDWSVDIMSEEWDEQGVLNKLKVTPDVLVCDALLNQDLFSGAGNIIKNEVLYRVRVHPLSKVGALPAARLKEMVRETRKYSFDFLRWRKDGVLKKHWLAYLQKMCLRCNLPFHKGDFGKNKRSSYYCSNCQEKFEI
jgi:endonuclease-8